MATTKEKKSPSAFSQLMEYAGRFRTLTYLSLILSAMLAWLVYVGALVCSHGSAFRTAANMKKTLMRHIAVFPSALPMRWAPARCVGS